MNQLVPILKGMYQNRFWIVCGLIAIVSLGVWYFVSSAQSQQRGERQADIERRDREIKAVLNTSASLPLDVEDPQAEVHPNAATSDGMNVEIDKATDTALEAWLIREQEQEPHLKYPTDQIGEHVADPLRKLNPLETLPDGYEVPENLRDTYAWQIKNRMSEIGELFGVNWKYGISEDAQAAAGGIGAIDVAKRHDLGTDAVVYWNEDNQEIWLEKMTKFSGLFGNNSGDANRPTTMQILVLQQDLWVLTALLDIIKNVNGDADQRDLAAVKDIDHILVGGRDAKRQDIGQISNAAAVKAAQATQTTKRKPKQNDGPSYKKKRATHDAARATARQKAGGAADGQFTWESTSPLHGRYVDRDFQPLTADEVKKVVSSNQLSDKAYLAVAKRVPVRVAVRMDEREIGKFLAAAANSPFVFEIRQVRINKHLPNEFYTAESGSTSSSKSAKSGDGKQIAFGGGSGGAAALGPDGETRNPGAGAGGPGAGNNANPSEVPAEQRTNFDVNVEFFGIVKLYNPVNEELFGRNKNAASGGAAQTPTAASPAAGNRP